jgi:predicted amidohydrolase YtcJ
MVKPAEPPADLVLIGGTIYTMDPLQPRAEGIAISGGRVDLLGSAVEVRRRVGERTQVIDLAGRAVTPGLVDAHCHLYGLGLALESVSLRGVKSSDEAVAKAAAAAAQRPRGEWITGRGWDQNLWQPAEFPSSEVLDRAISDHPVALRRIDGHALWANAEAMKRAGITAATKDPSGGKIIRDAAGKPTGVFIDNAMDLIEAQIPQPSHEVRIRRILLAADTAAAAGLTGVHEMGIDEDTVNAYRELAAQGKLKLRVHAFLDGSLLETLPSRTPDVDANGTAMFALRGVKLYADGALGSRGALLLAPYSDDPKNSGLALLTPDQLRHGVDLAVSSGWQLAVHAIGDAANRAVLDAVAAGAGGRTDLRFRIEHAQVVAPEDIPRFAQLGVIASMQPTHATSDMPWAEQRLGPERIKGAYAWRSLKDAGARIAGGSDFPVEEVPPLLGLYAATTRQDAAGSPDGGWTPEQRLTLDEAIRLYTVEAAYASFEDGKRGVLAPGYVADLTVFDRDLLAGQALLGTQIDLTIVGGAIVYDHRR